MFSRGQEFLLKYEYDFAVDGGAVGSIDMRADVNLLSSECKVVDCYMFVETAVTSGGAPSLVLGDGSDANGYLEDFATEAIAGSDVRAGEIPCAYLWDDTNDHYLVKDAGAGVLKLAIGTAALTAGKFQVYLKCVAK